MSLVQKLTRATRAADKEFESVGGSSRHWVLECFLPALEEEGLVIVTADQVAVTGRDDTTNGGR